MDILLNRFGTILMRVLFTPLFGWTATLPEEVKSIDIEGVDGSSLEGGITESTAGEVQGVVILSHPFIKYGLHYFIKKNLHAKLAAAGYHVIFFNFKGFGSSKVNGPSFYDDVSSTYAWAASKYPDLNINLLGWSFGGYHSVHALKKHPLPFSSVVFDSVPFTIERFFKRGFMAKGLKSILMFRRLAEITGVKEIETTLSELKEHRILYLYGSDDPFITEDDLREFRKTQTPNLELMEFDSCGHNELYDYDQQAYLDLVIGFMQGSMEKTEEINER